MIQSSLQIRFNFVVILYLYLAILKDQSQNMFTDECKFLWEYQLLQH